ncbi:MAG: hypothetical protein M1814_006383 [Vezdaea aestivalis]|nr:MAG: hypothetical protein M1814_006383 [Vezdaea aestivalis]
MTTPIANQRVAALLTSASSIQTCNSSTIVELQTLLQPSPTLPKSARPKQVLLHGKPVSAAATKKPPAKLNTKHAAQEDAKLSPRERYALATSIVNDTLRTLSVCVKSPPSLPAIDIRLESKGSLQKVSCNKARPFEERALNRGNPPAQRRSASNTKHHVGVVAVAECCYEGLIGLRGLKMAKEAVIPEAQVERGLAAFVGKMVALGLVDMATKSVRMLRKWVGEISADKKRKSEEEETKKENLASLIDFGIVDDQSPFLDLIIQTQMLVLKVLALRPTVQYLEPLVKLLERRESQSPVELILGTDRSKHAAPKAAQQLETIAQLLLSICQTVSDGLLTENNNHASIIFTARCLALRTRIAFWNLVAHQAMPEKEIVKPFAKYLHTFWTQSVGYPERYGLGQQQFELLKKNLIGFEKPTVEKDDSAWLKIYQTLSAMAREAANIQDALKWTTRAFALIQSKDSSEAIFQICATRVAALNLLLLPPAQRIQDKTLLAGLAEAVSGLNQNIRGDASDLEALLAEVVQFRKAAVRQLNDTENIQAGQNDSDASLTKLCCRIISTSASFCSKYVGTPPSESDSIKQHVHFEQRLNLARKWCTSSIDAAFWAVKLQVDQNFPDWEILDEAIGSSLALASLISDDLTQQYSKASNLYWYYYKWLSNQQDGAKGKNALRTVRKAVQVLRGRPEAERANGVYGHKCERLVSLLDHNGRYEEALDTIEDAVDTYLDGPTLHALAITSAQKSSDQIWKLDEQYLAIKRCISTMIRLFLSKHQTAAERFKLARFSTRDASVRGLVLELILAELLNSARSSAARKKAKDAIQIVVEELLGLYTAADYPIRRLRLYLLLVNLEIEHPQLSSKEWVILSENLSVKDGTGNDEGLLKYRPQLLASLSLVSELRKTPPCHTTLQALIEVVWGIVENVESAVDNPALLVSQLQSVSQWFHIHGHGRPRLMVLGLILRIHSLTAHQNGSTVAEANLELGHQYLTLGYSIKAAECFRKAQQQIDISPQSQLKAYYAETESHLILEQLPSSLESFSDAHSLVSRSPVLQLSQHSLSLSQKAANNMLHAQGWSLKARISFLQDQPSLSTAFSRVSIRLLHRAWACLENSPDTTAKSELEVDTLPVLSTTHEALNNPALWTLALALFRALLFHALLFVHQGSLREAFYYLDQAQRIAEAARSDALLAHVNAVKGEQLSRSGAVEEGQLLLDKAKTLADGHDPALLDVNLHCALGYVHQKRKCAEDEIAEYELAEQIAMELATKEDIIGLARPKVWPLEVQMSSLALEDSKPKARRKAAPRLKAATTTIRAKPATRKVKAPTVDQPGESLPEGCHQILQAKASVMQQKASALIDQSRPDLAAGILAELEKLPCGRRKAISRKVVMAKHFLYRAAAEMDANAVYCVLQDSTIAFPSLEVADIIKASPLSATQRRQTPHKSRRRSKTPCSEEFEDHLICARDCLIDAYNLAVKAASFSVMQSVSIMLTGASLFLSAVKSSQPISTVHPVTMAYNLEMSRISAFNREKATLSANQLLTSSDDLLQWPQAHPIAQIRDDLPQDASQFQTTYLDNLPAHWNVVSLTLNEARDELLLCKMQAGRSPFLVRLPLGRHSSRELADEPFGFDHGIMELEEIIRLANASTQNAKNMTKKAAKATWWAEREALDARMKDLLLAIEGHWLGGFRGIFKQPLDEQRLQQFQDALQDILDKNLPSRRRAKRGNKVRPLFDDHVMELFVGLGDPEDETLEIEEALMDLLYFVVDILQFHGERNAYDEIDFDALTIETIDALKAIHNAPSLPPHPFSHTLLILPPILHPIPWESLPALSSLSTSRLPTLAILPSLIPSIFHPLPSIGTSLLNPAADLPSTESHFTPLLDPLSSWTHHTSPAPSPSTLKSILENSNIYLYLGHGHGSAYLRGRDVRSMDGKAPVALLMGCSSAKVQERGEFEGEGGVRDWVLGGSRAVVGWLWDGTDKEVDRFAEGVGREWGLFEGTERAVEGVGAVKGVSLCEAVREARGKCMLGCLSGAAPVVWGVPVWLG